MRISKVYTKSGDSGETSLVDGSRVSKADLRVAAYGDVDELNSLLGIARIDIADDEFDQLLGRMQNELFIVGADLATPAGTNVPRVGEPLVIGLEESIDLFNSQLEPLREFVLPGGGRPGAIREEINLAAVRYLNRLSDLLFVMARLANKRAGVNEQPANFSERGKR
jgi:cob(I)alamin adenosyltransferase